MTRHQKRELFEKMFAALLLGVGFLGIRAEIRKYSEGLDGTPKFENPHITRLRQRYGIRRR